MQVIRQLGTFLIRYQSKKPEMPAASQALLLTALLNSLKYILNYYQSARP